VHVAPNGFKSATRDDAKIAEWLDLFEDEPFNWGMEPECVIDVDPRHGGMESIDALQNEIGPITYGYMVETPSGGYHIYYLRPAGVQIKNNNDGKLLGPGIDVKTAGGYVLIPPSANNGKPYSSVGDPGNVFELPAALVLKLANGSKNNGTLIHPYAESPRHNFVRTLNGVPEGERDNTLYSYACSLQARGYPYGEASVLIHNAATNCLPPYDSAKVDDMIRRVYGKYGDPPSCDGHSQKNGMLLAESELRDAFLERAKGRLVRGLGSFLEYENGYWKRGDILLAERHAQETLEDLGIPVQVRSVEKMVRLAKPYMGVSDTIWDREPYKLVLGNGTFDLESGELEPHNPENYITAAVPYDYDPDATGPTWDEYTLYLTNVLGEETVEFIREYFAYCLTADSSHELMVFLTGDPGSGKSTLLAGAETMLGEDLHTSLSLKKIQERFGRSKIVGKRLIVSPELPSMALLETEMIDALISGEAIDIEEKNKPSYDYAPVAKVIQACNDMPVVPNPRQGLNRRVVVVSFPPLIGKPRKELKETIRREGPYILNWALEGWPRLRERGCFEIPKAIRRDTETWKHENNTVAVFLEECLEDGAYRIKPSELQKLYMAWCKENNLKALGRKNYQRNVREVDFYRIKMGATNGINYLKGVDLTDEGEVISKTGYDRDIVDKEIMR